MFRSILPNGVDRAILRRSTLAPFLLLLALSPLRAADQPDEETASLETPATFLETVTVAATLSERTLDETPGQVDVVSAEEIERLGHTDVLDLVRFAPGVYLENDPTRLGVGGFNIRGVGGNRVQTRIDGIPTSEQFEFGPLTATQISFDLDVLESVEIVRSAGSALYGSDALGGVISLTTRSPRSFLQGGDQYFGFRAGFDGRNEEASGSLTYARGGETFQGALIYTRRDGAEADNQGDVDAENFTRTAPNPIDRRQDDVLLKLSWQAGENSDFLLAYEDFSTRSDTQVFSSQAPASPFSSAVLDFDAIDRQDRRRLSLEHSLVLDSLLADSLTWRIYRQETDTEQVTDELREDFVGPSARDGLFSFDQESTGIRLEAYKVPGDGEHVLTYGFLHRRDGFDVLRDRADFYIADGSPVPTTLVFPSKYFPESEVTETGVFVQGELNFGRLRLVPGLRYDRFELDPEQNDVAFLTGNPGQPIPVGLTDDAISPKLGMVLALPQNLSVFAQYARGFRAPPMSAVNNGFTNRGGGYRTLSNPELSPETSDNFELGLRGRFARGGFSITAFENRYDDFIDLVVLGFNPMEFLLEFQSQNVDETEISGFEFAGDLHFGDGWLLRGAWSVSEGDNITSGEPLDSIAPSRLVLGLRWAPPAARWGAELNVTSVDSKSDSDLPDGSTQFRTPSYETADLAFWLNLSERWTLNLTAWNLGDETYWTWGAARGLSATSLALDRYTSPGRNFGVQLRARF